MQFITGLKTATISSHKLKRVLRPEMPRSVGNSSCKRLHDAAHSAAARLALDREREMFLNMYDIV